MGKLVDRGRSELCWSIKDTVSKLTSDQLRALPRSTKPLSHYLIDHVARGAHSILIGLLRRVVTLGQISAPASLSASQPATSVCLTANVSARVSTTTRARGRLLYDETHAARIRLFFTRALLRLPSGLNEERRKPPGRLESTTASTLASLWRCLRGNKSQQSMSL